MTTEPDNDPTRSGSSLPDRTTGRLRLSLSEIEALSSKAARGAGMSWGLAEEAGFAVRWLAERGFDGPALLLAHLDRLPALHWRQVSPVISGRHWSATGREALCPVAVGATLCDFAGQPEGPTQGAIAIASVSSPGLVLPFVAAIAQRFGAALRVEWTGCAVILAGKGILSITGTHALSDTTGRGLRITPCASRESDWTCGAQIQTELTVLRRLDAYAHRTYVPASEQSRRGAGAGGSDSR